MEEKLLTTKEVAEYFQVSSDTVLVILIKKGLKYIPVGAKDYRYNKKDVLEFEEMIKETYDGKHHIDYQFNVNRFKNSKKSADWEFL